MVGADLGHRALLGDVTDQRCRVRELLAAELDDDALGAGFQLLDIGLAAQRLDEDDLEQVLDLFRQRPEAVDELGTVKTCSGETRSFAVS